MGSVLTKLTENIVERNLVAEGEALLNKWEQTGLLEGLTSSTERRSMSLLLENQAKELLREASAMSTGDVEGFAAVAFPLVRRVFGNIVANDLVSVQPMSLPSGLIFFLDFQHTDTKVSAGAVAAQSLFGGNRVGVQITGGIDLSTVDETNDVWSLEKGPYSLNNAYSSPTSSASVVLTFVARRSGSNNTWDMVANADSGQPLYQNRKEELVQYDADLSGSVIAVYTCPKTSLTGLNENDLVAVHTNATGTMSPFTLVRRLTRHDPVSGSSRLLLVFATNGSGSVDTTTNIRTANYMSGSTKTLVFPVDDSFVAGQGLGSVVGSTPWGLEGTPDLLSGTGTNADIPEIDIKVDSLAVTAKTKKLKARWTPELGQDLNAYHNLDAEVELTTILSEQIALEIDQEILVDLIKGATAATYHWSRRPGKFVNKTTGIDLTANGANLPDFTGTVSEWYETLVETINDVSAQIHRKTLRGGANFIVCSPEVANILEFTSGFRASVTGDAETGTVGAVAVGSISKKWDVYVNPYFPRNLVLVGRKGKSFLESGYVYAPYVPLQVTPTIFGTEDFTPRKGVMTRYAKQMVRPDMYGLVVVADLLG
jgi:hypothetical protein